MLGTSHGRDPMSPVRRDVMRDQNRALIFGIILTQGPLSRSEIARRSDLSAATVSKAVQPLLDDGYLMECAEQQTGLGRPSTPIQINARRHVVVGVKLTGEMVTAVLVDLNANVLATQSATLRSKRVENVVGVIQTVARSLIDEHANGAPPFGIGIGLGGHVDSRNGVVRYAPFLGWHDVAFAGLVEDALGLPCLVENDVNALALAELWFDEGRGFSDFAVVTVGAGIGCGLVSAGRVMQGATGAAGEIGHLPVDPQGEDCVCGRRGCLETLASDQAILRHIATLGGKAFRTIVAAAEGARVGDEAARIAFERAGIALGIGLSTVINLFNPSRIILSGEGVVASDLFMKSLFASVEANCFSTAAADCEIISRPLGQDMWARGAASTVIAHLISRSAHLTAAEVRR